MDSHVDRVPDTVQEPESHPVDEIEQLQAKVTQLEHAVDSHALIDQAMGVIIAVGRISPAEAWDLLRETSMRTNIKLRHVAELVVAWGETGNLAADIRDELARRLGSTG
ncbi:ANTAR domain-containing protein [Streptomyces sp. NPDC055722]